MKYSNCKANVKVNEIRVANNLTQVEFAKILGIKQSYLSIIESGRQKPSEEIIRSIKANYGDDVIEFNDLFEKADISKGDEPINKIKELRLKHNLTQVEFAERIGISRSRVSTYEHNGDIPPKPVVKLIALQFGVDENFLDDEPVNKVKELRLSKNLTQLEFGEMLGLTETDVNSIETGLEKPSIQTIKLLALQFDVSENDFI